MGQVSDQAQISEWERFWSCYIKASLVPSRVRVPARNSLVNEVEFLGLILQKW